MSTFYQKQHDKYPSHRPHQSGHHARQHQLLHPKNDGIPTVHPSHHSGDVAIAQPSEPPKIHSQYTGWHIYHPSYAAFQTSHLPHVGSGEIFGLGATIQNMYPGGIPTNHFPRYGCKFPSTHHPTGGT